jgi:ferredoxin
MPQKLIQPSTREYIREARQMKDFSFFDLLHGYLYARFPYFYIAMGTGQHPLAKRLAPLVAWIGSFMVKHAGKSASGSAVKFEDTYHGKVVPLQAARQLVSVHEPVDLPNLEHIVPYAKARDIILKNPDHIAVMDCPCRTAREHPCLPLEVCLVVGEPFASFVVEHNPQKARMITSEEAQAILKAEDERGHVHHAFFKDAMLGRFYAICNCCSCCCAALKAQRNGTPMLASSGYVAQIDENRCAACGNCVETCPFDALTLDSMACVDVERCMGCGVCVDQCPAGAITLMRMQSKGAPLEIETLMQAAAR